MSEFITDHPLKTAARERINHFMELATRIFGREFSPPKLDFDKKGNAAGSYKHAQNRISLNWILLRENKDHFINETIPHELCHKFCRDIHGMGVKSHGSEWKEICVKMGYTPNRTHNFSLKTIQNNKVQSKIAKVIGARCSFSNFLD